MSAPPVARPMLGTGQVRHTRLRPARNQFTYPTYFLMLPMRSLRAAPCAALARNRFGLIAFHDRDHGDGRADSLAWLDEQLASQGVTDATGEVWLHCYPRVLGHTFKPVSFWYCHRPDGSLAAIVVEVNNTFGERHCYLLAGDGVAYGRELQAAKAFHVSPFCRVEGRYRFRFLHAGLLHPSDGGLRTEEAGTAPHTHARTIARIDHDDQDGVLLQTSVSGHLTPLTARTQRAAFWGMPLMTFGVIARIHWQALRLWAKRVPFFSKPEAPKAFVTH